MHGQGNGKICDLQKERLNFVIFQTNCCTIYVLITLEVPLLSVSNFCQDSKWKCLFDVLPKKGGIRSITCCCVWTHHYHHKGSGLVCSAGFFRRMRAPELAHGCGACASCHRCSWTLVDTNSYLSFLKVVRVETQAGGARFVILVPGSNHVWCFLVSVMKWKRMGSLQRSSHIQHKNTLLEGKQLSGTLKRKDSISLFFLRHRVVCSPAWCLSRVTVSLERTHWSWN